jgi:hypothetical protein
MNSSISPQLSVELPTLSEAAVQVRMMRELFIRTRESALVGFLPVFLIVWAHWHAQPREQLLFWTVGALAVLSYRMVIAQLYLAHPQTQAARRRLWFGLEWLGAVGMAAIWVISITTLGTRTRRPTISNR